MTSPAGPVGIGIFAIEYVPAPRVSSMDVRYCVMNCELPVMANAWPETNLFTAWSSSWVNVSGSSRPSATSPWKYSSISLNSGRAAV